MMVIPHWKERVTPKSILTLLLFLIAMPLPAAEWKLVWSDEFDKPGQPDPAKWGYEEGFIRNNERQFYNHVQHTNKGSKITIAKPYEDFHVYAVEWRPERIDFFVDKTKYFTFKNEGKGDAAWPYDKPQYLILNIAIGGDWGGQKGIDDHIFPQRMYIDYVRVYQEQNSHPVRSSAK